MGLYFEKGGLYNTEDISRLQLRVLELIHHDLYRPSVVFTKSRAALIVWRMVVAIARSSQI